MALEGAEAELASDPRAALAKPYQTAELLQTVVRLLAGRRALGAEGP